MLIESFLVVAGGLILYGCKKIVIDPIQEFRSVRKNISKDLVKYGNVISNPGSADQGRIDDAESDLRDDASDLKSAVDDIPKYDSFADIGIVPSREDAKTAKRNLIGLSNSVEEGDPMTNHEMREDVESSLGLDD
ncbi:hypothetical protein [Natronococcus occultus]|uniref:hypothetical protein n=1 Tax=Natronococcus occultus TaxID=29288 RepID=UPI0012F73992|nr:hypothetical protein [Natronococcus occultus]